MGWTWDDYLNQPIWFIQMLSDQLEVEAENTKKQQKKLKSKK